MPILLYTTLLFWTVTLLQAAMVPFWLGDLVFIMIFIWWLYFAYSIEKFRYKVWNFWIPPVIGIGVSSFLFNRFRSILPYFLVMSFLTYLITRKIKWIFRYKEGIFYCFVAFFIYFISVAFVLSYIMKYSVSMDFYSRTAVTMIVLLIVWTSFAFRGKQGKIR